MTKLEQAVAEWIRAEWEFRCGVQAYQGNTPDWLSKTERRLRRALTGKGDLDEAFNKLKNETKKS